MDGGKGGKGSGKGGKDGGPGSGPRICVTDPDCNSTQLCCGVNPMNPGQSVCLPAGFNGADIVVSGKHYIFQCTSMKNATCKAGSTTCGTENCAALSGSIAMDGKNMAFTGTKCVDPMYCGQSVSETMGGNSLNVTVNCQTSTPSSSSKGGKGH